MKKRIFAAVMALCLMTGTSVFAQDAKQAPMPKEKWTPEQMAQKRADKMTEKLKLNKEQSKQVYDYSLAQIKQMQAKKETMHADRKAEMEKMKGILTPEQFEQWQKMQAERMQKGRQGMHKQGARMDRKEAGKGMNEKPEAPKPEEKK